MTTRTPIKLTALLFALLMLTTGALASAPIGDVMYPHKDIDNPEPVPTDGPQWPVALMVNFNVPHAMSLGNVVAFPTDPIPAWASKQALRAPHANY